MRRLPFRLWVCVRWLWNNRPENFYRDVALLVISVILFSSVSSQSNQQDGLEIQTDNLAVIAKQNRALSIQFCELIANVHDANKARVRSERNRLHTSLVFLRKLEPSEKDSNLARIARNNVPNIRADVKAARQSAIATLPPPACLGPAGPMR